jgi:hypothetical protein
MASFDFDRYATASAAYLDLVYTRSHPLPPARRHPFRAMRRAIIARVSLAVSAACAAIILAAPAGSLAMLAGLVHL